MKKTIILVVVVSVAAGLLVLQNLDNSGDLETSHLTKSKQSRKLAAAREYNESLIPLHNPTAHISNYDQFKDAYRVSLYEKLEALKYEEAYGSILENKNKFQDDSDFQVLLRAVLKRWGEADPKKVLGIISNNEDLALDAQEIPAILQSVARGIAKKNSRTAFEWMKEAEESGLIASKLVGDGIYSVILQEHARQYSEEVVEIFHEIEMEEAKLMVIHPLLENLTKKDFSAATDLVLSIPKGELRDKAMENLIKYNNKNPQLLADTFLENQNFVSKEEIAESLDKLAESDFQVAKKTLLEAEGAGQNEFILTRFASSQALVDGERLHSLVEEITDPKLRDNVIGNIANSYTTTNLGIGISVAADIKNANQRIQTISQIIQKGSDEQIQGFRDYFDEFPEMPAAEKAIYLEQLNERLTNIEGD